MKRSILLMVTALSMWSCVGLTHITSPNSVSLNQGNFKFVKTVSAETQASYILGIGGFSDQANVDVIDLLRRKANLAQNQALADIHIKKTTKVWALGFYITRILTATATVVEFSSDESNNFLSQENHKDFETSDNSEDLEISTIPTTNTTIPTTYTTIPTTYTKDYAIQRLTEINHSLLNGEIQNVESIMAEVEEIKKWYKGQDIIYTEIVKLLKSINRYYQESNVSGIVKMKD